MTISFARHQFPPVIIRHAVWLYVRFTLSSIATLKICSRSAVWMSPTKRYGDGFGSSGDCSPENFAVDALGQRRNGISMRSP
jgi:hypothetical protein